ncbi:uncharacterized protein LOC128674127 isoform X2 [Plodia interpunctella]|uniref:uncharacterized protein LOC128674127 isoform X2 n=1 Tax=Plodia interpunctella TaxID=58824 RepID=UPI002368D033|nr:uncharacterized protein LOC128674127 isoform X2 [Plodia interpunctella]
MYKTVRHGENSLQYTILPQTEEVLNNSGLKGKGRDYSPSIHVRRSRRRSTVKYVLLIIFGIIVALALASVPLYVMNGALYSRKNQQDNHEVVTSAPLAPTGRELAKSRKKELKVSPAVISSFDLKPEASTTTPSTTTKSPTTPSTVTSDRVTLAWTMPLFRSWKSFTSTTIKPIPTETIESTRAVTPTSLVPLLDRFMTMKPWEKELLKRVTVSPEPITLRNLYRYYSRSYPERVEPKSTKRFDDIVITTKGTTTRTPVTTEFTTSERSVVISENLKDAILSVDDDDDLKESLEVDEVFSLPSSASAGSDADEVTVAKTGGAEWYGARWPFVDTSSYFQWTGYSPGDNLLLPLLVAALSSVALVLLLALAVRRKRSHVSAQLGLTSELQAEDNTNLLTAENPDETEE